MIASHYDYFVFGVQLIGGILLLTNHFMPLALILLAPVIANILVFHITMQPEGLPPAIVVAILWLIVAYQVRTALRPVVTNTHA